MTLIADVRAAQLQARKNKHVEAVDTLTTLIGESEAVGKNAGNRAPTDQEVVAVVKKFIKNIDETMGVINPDTDAYSQFQREKILLSQFLPKQMTEAEIKAAAQSLFEDLVINTGGLGVKPKMGVLMQHFKAKYDGQYDGAVASKIIKEILA
jgi:uncharacterized protein